MTATLANSTLDAVLTLQFTVAWAGEGRSDPKRLAWWDTDVIDAAGGGDFFARLTPRTHAWTSLEAAREAARRIDAESRRAIARPDRTRTLFALGFEVDERLQERLATLKAAGGSPIEVLPWAIRPGDTFSRAALTDAFAGRASAPKFDVVPGGRQLKGAMPVALDLAAHQLVAALVPLSDRYPAPFFRVET